MTANPKVEFVSSARSLVLVEARVIFDTTRLSLETQPNGPQKLAQNTAKLNFQFEPIEKDFGIDQTNPNPDIEPLK